MNNTKRFDLKSILIALAIVLLCLSLLFTTACSDNSATNSSSSSASSSTEDDSITDYQTISNGDFEFQTDEKEATDFPVSSSIMWTRSNDSLATSANSSDYSSGIIDTTEDNYKTIAKDNDFPVESGSGDDAVYFNPRTPEYYGLVKNAYTYSETSANSDKYPTSGSKVLMIHNKLKSTDKRGTAQKFTSSSSVSIESGTYGHLSLWVMTKDLKTLQDTTNIGAYVSLTNTVSSAKNPLIIDKINTDGNWIQLNFYLEANSFTTTSFKVVLGLGTGSRKVMNDYVEGFAYFDNINYETISLSEYKTATASVDKDFNLYQLETAPKTTYEETSADSLKENLALASYYETAKSNGSTSTSYDSTKEFTRYDYSFSYDIPSVLITANLTSALNDVYNNPADPTKAEFNKNSNVGQAAFSTIASSVSGVTNPLGADASTGYMIFNSPSSYTMKTQTMTIADGEFKIINFYVKVKTSDAATGLTINLIQLGSSLQQTETTSTVYTNLKTNTYENENTNDWAYFSILVANDKEDGYARDYRLEFSFGPTTSGTTDLFLYPEGYALITGVSEKNLTTEQYAMASISSSYTSTISLGNDNPATSTEEKTDAYSFSYAQADNLKIETGTSRSVIGYTGVVGGHTMVGGENTAYSQDKTVAGIINTEYDYPETVLSNDDEAAIKALSKDGDNKYLQPLIINNTDSTSYGYIGSSSTISSAATTMVSVKLKVLGDAKAYVYIVDADPLSGFNPLSIQANTWTLDTSASTVTAGTDYAINKEFIMSVDKDDCIGVGGWVTVNFIITAGDDAINYRVEVWNGTRDGATSGYSKGVVAINSITTSTPTVSTVVNDILAEYGDTSSTINKIEYERYPVIVTTYDDKSAVVESFRKYNSSVVYTEYAKAKTVIATYETINAATEIDETSQSASSSSSATSSTTNPTDWTLQIVSIIIAAVLILVLVLIIIRKLVKDAKSKKIAAIQFYNKDSRARTLKKINTNKQDTNKSAKTSKTAPSTTETANEETSQNSEAQNEIKNNIESEAKADTEEKQEYDYDNMENNIPKD